MSDTDDRAQIDDLIARFYAAFGNRNGRIPSIDALADVFMPGATVVHDLGSHGAQYSLSEFAEPRLRLLTSGELVDFHEWETASSTEIAGRVASRASSYRKHGTFGNQPYAGGGRKFFQLGKLADDWRICALAWSDDDSVA